jgi:hypothetical protein
MILPTSPIRSTADPAWLKGSNVLPIPPRIARCGPPVPEPESHVMLFPVRKLWTYIPVDRAPRGPKRTRYYRRSLHCQHGALSGLLSIVSGALRICDGNRRFDTVSSGCAFEWYGRASDAGEFLGDLVYVPEGGRRPSAALTGARPAVGHVGNGRRVDSLPARQPPMSPARRTPVPGHRPSGFPPRSSGSSPAVPRAFVQPSRRRLTRRL